MSAWVRSSPSVRSTRAEGDAASSSTGRRLGGARTVVPRDVHLGPAAGLPVPRVSDRCEPGQESCPRAGLPQPPARTFRRVTDILGITTFNFLTSCVIALQAQHTIGAPYISSPLEDGAQEQRHGTERNAEPAAEAHVHRQVCRAAGLRTPAPDHVCDRAWGLHRQEGARSTKPGAESLQGWRPDICSILRAMSKSPEPRSVLGSPLEPPHLHPAVLLPQDLPYPQASLGSGHWRQRQETGQGQSTPAPHLLTDLSLLHALTPTGPWSSGDRPPALRLYPGC